jgi:two-component system OmpR family response regulator
MAKALTFHVRTRQKVAVCDIFSAPVWLAKVGCGPGVRMPNPMHVLIVDDEPRIRTMLRRYLGEEGFKVTEAKDGAEMTAALARGMVDLVLLDLVMPGDDGLSLARQVRQRSAIPIIMLTGKGDLIDRVAGLETGADDYITKPFELREVLARIRSVLRRTAVRMAAAGSAASAFPKENAGSVFLFEGYRLDLQKRELRDKAGNIVPLTAGEFDLLLAFARNPNRVLNRDQLLDLVKGRDWAAYDRGVDTQIMRLRKKIETNPHRPALIKTVRGAGYVFAAAVKSE